MLDHAALVNLFTQLGDKDAKRIVGGHLDIIVKATGDPEWLIVAMALSAYRKKHAPPAKTLEETHGTDNYHNIKRKRGRPRKDRQ